MVPLPSPQQLRYLTTLAELGHFGRAAAACGVTQSTLSAGILALERQLDVAILDRSGGKRPVFTPVGEELEARARQALSALETVAEIAVAARAPLAGTLRLGMIPTIAPFILPTLLPALREGFPRLRLSVIEDVTASLVERLGTGRLDLLLLALPCACDGLETLTLGRDPFLVVVPDGHPLARQESVALDSLQRETLLLLEEGHCLRDQALDACRQDGAWGPDPTQERFAATSLQTLVQLVENGLGVTLLPRLAVEAGIVSHGRVAVRPVDGPGAGRTLGLAWRARSPRQPEFLQVAALLEPLLSRRLPA